MHMLGILTYGKPAINSCPCMAVNFIFLPRKVYDLTNIIISFTA